MDDLESGVSARDRTVVARQLGREPRGRWRPASRCAYGFPNVIATSPTLEDGSPFPTLFWLTCPWLGEIISEAESSGGVAVWAERLANDPDLAARMREADAAYRDARLAEGGGLDPAAHLSAAGLRDVTRTKCLHAHAAAFLAGIGDPIGESVLAGRSVECEDARCQAWAGEVV